MTIIEAQNEDCRRGEFLRAIDAGVENLSEFEINFISSFLGDCALRNPIMDFKWFTEPRRRVVDGMIQRYGFRKHQAPNTKPQLPEHVPGCCGYLMPRENGIRQERCGGPAVIKLSTGLELCAEHDEMRKAGLEKLRAAKQRRNS